MRAARTGRTHDRTRPRRQHENVALARRGPSTHDPVMGHGGRAGNRDPRPAFPLNKPAVAALLGLAAGQPPPPPFALPGVEAGHPEERLAVLAAGVTGLAVDALAFLGMRGSSCSRVR